jgi:hypothetical protein
MCWSLTARWWWRRRRRWWWTITIDRFLKSCIIIWCIITIIRWRIGWWRRWRWCSIASLWWNYREKNRIE